MLFGETVRSILNEQYSEMAGKKKLFEIGPCVAVLMFNARTEK